MVYFKNFILILQPIIEKENNTVLKNNKCRI